MLITLWFQINVCIKKILFGFLFHLLTLAVIVLFKPLEQASTYFSAQGIPFPKILLNEEEKKDIKECYVFEEANNPEAPIVLYFPLVNDTFQRYIAPGELIVQYNRKYISTRCLILNMFRCCLIQDKLIDQRTERAHLTEVITVEFFSQKKVK